MITKYRCSLKLIMMYIHIYNCYTFMSSFSKISVLLNEWMMELIHLNNGENWHCS